MISRSAEEIARVLGMLLARAEPIRSELAGGELVFESRLRFIDPDRAYILLDPGADLSASAALLARARASFHASPDSWHIEFAAADPQHAQHDGQAVIRLRFPEVLATQQRRAHERSSVQPQVPLHFLADADGVISFDGYMVDLSSGGLGFLQYAPNITLEPGTLLKGCRIELPGRAPVAVDLEVRYSRMVTLADGKRALRSGCRFVNPSSEVKALLLEQFIR